MEPHPLATGEYPPWHPKWYKALTLTERLALLRSDGNAPELTAAERARAEERIERWRAQAPFKNPTVYAQRLAMDGVSPAELLRVLAEPASLFRCHVPTPEWLSKTQSVLSASSGPGSLPSPPLQKADNSFDLLYLVEPLIQASLAGLRPETEVLFSKFANGPIDPGTVVHILFPILAKRLLAMIARTAALELNVARLEGVLEGSTPGERFRSFVRQIGQAEKRMAILLEYPVLARQVVNCVDLWLAFSLELLGRMSSDWPRILKAFGPEADPGVLVGVEDTGDTHKEGRCVLILKFASGWRLVYKPRSMSVDVHFQALLDWSNDCLKETRFRTLNILDAGSHGWVEFVAAAPCASEDELRRFYRRQGGYLALLYVLQASDFHSENVIAAGERPVLIDLEALFHASPEDLATAKREDPAAYTLATSVLRIGLLPQRIWGDTEREGIDISGLGSQAGQLTPFAVPQWEKAATDEMQFTRKRVTSKTVQNRPSLTGSEMVDLLDYSEDIAAGFAEVYRLLMRYRERLLSGHGPLTAFSNDRVRLVLRATRTYEVLLGESFHPDMLGDALEREQLFDRLWVATEDEPYLARVVAAERHDLENADIPIFTTEVKSRDLVTSSGARITSFLPRSGLELVHQQLGLLSEEDLGRQLWFIHASLATLAPEPEQQVEASLAAPKPQSFPARNELLAAARAIGDRLARLALRGDEVTTWLGLVREESGQWSVLPLGLDLYDGIPGVTLFLAYLGNITGEERYTHLARAAWATFERELKKNRDSISWTGALAGWGGIIYAHAHLGVLWNDHSLLADAIEFVEQLPSLIDQDEQLDIYAGAAGYIASLLALYEVCPSPQVRNAAVQAGEHLIARTQTMNRGAGWVIPSCGPQPAIGLAHGGAGIAWALLRLAASTGDERFQTIARAAMEYERTQIFTETGGEQDKSDPSRGTVAKLNANLPTSWCRGLAGIGLARLDIFSLFNPAQIRNEINAALSATLDRGFGLDHSLCHGDLGVIELLLRAKDLLDDSYWNARIQRAAASILGDIREHGWRCGTPQAIESPGLMTGLAGIGYGLLRLAEPMRVPSLLLFRPPGPSSQYT